MSARAALALLLLPATAALATAPAAEVPADSNGVAASVVYIQVFRAGYDWSQPWQQEPVGGVSGSGFLIDSIGHRATLGLIFVLLAIGVGVLLAQRARLPRPHVPPQQYSVTISWNSASNGVARLSAAST